MDNLRDIDDESCNGSDDLVEYAAEEVEDEQEELYAAHMEIDSEDMIDDANQPEEYTEEEYYEEDEATDNMAVLDKCKTSQTFKIQQPAAPISREPKVAVPENRKIPDINRIGQKVIMVPQTSANVTTTMKILNSSKAPPTSTLPTTSYRLMNSDGTMIMNVANKPSTVKKVISVSSSNPSPSTPTKVILNPNTRVVKTVTMKTMNVANPMKAVNMKTIPASTIKMVPQTTPLPTTVLRMTKPQALVPGVSLPTTTKIVKGNAANFGSEFSKVIIKPCAAGSPTKKVAPSSSAPLRTVTLAGGKGVQYVRLVNQRPTTAAGTVQKIVIQPSNKTPITSPGAVVSANSMVVTGASGGPVQAGSSKIFVQNNKTYVVRNGTTNVTALAGGKPQIVSTNRKIVLNAGSTHQDQDGVNSGLTRIIVKKDPDGKPLDGKVVRTVVQKPHQPSNGATVVKLLNASVGAGKLDQQSPASVKLEWSNNAGSSSLGSVKVNMEENDYSQLAITEGFGYPEEAYKRRSCNCTKSQCLKLYCDCFASGEKCYKCNCKDCHNTSENTVEREKAIKSTLDRNPNAFKPKIGSIGTTDDGTRLHTKGCNCKRSGCLKNYCECYEGKIACSSNCKCVGCRNTDHFSEEYDYFTAQDYARRSHDDGSIPRLNVQTPGKSVGSPDGKTSSSEMGGIKRSSSCIDTDLSQLPPTKQPHNFMTMDVIEATVQCMVAQADECMKRGCSMRTSERMILEEYGRCLLEIKEFAFNTDN